MCSSIHVRLFLARPGRDKMDYGIEQAEGHMNEVGAKNQEDPRQQLGSEAREST